MNKKHGFTFLEVLAAIFILALMLGSVLYLMQSSTRTMSMNRDDFVAHCAIYELAEQILSTPWNDVPTGVFTDSDLLDGQTLGTGTTWLLRLSPTEKAARRLEISAGNTSRGPVYKKITVTLTYPALPGSQVLRQFSRTVLYARETL